MADPPDHAYQAEGFWIEVGKALDRRDWPEADRLHRILGKHLRALRVEQTRQRRREEDRMRPTRIRNLAIFHCVVLDGHTLKETGQAFGICGGRVAQITGQIARREFDVRGPAWWNIKNLRTEFQDG